MPREVHNRCPAPGLINLRRRGVGEASDARSTSIQLSEARDELQLLMRGIEGIQKLCEELESDDS
jgi:hypothetical protein